MVSGRAELVKLIENGVITPPARIVGFRWNKQVVGQIESDGSVTFGGRRYESLSMAASMALRSVGASTEAGAYQHVNGWSFWRMETADGLTPIGTLRDHDRTGRARKRTRRVSPAR
jgi:Restriction Enzyme Adenine Methylase Associated